MSELTVGRITFTPGPWEAIKLPFRDITLVSGNDPAKMAGGYVAEINRSGMTAADEDIAAANARLLAAAPDLLAACKLALEPGAEDTDERERRRAVVRAAIAKAEGQC